MSGDSLVQSVAPHATMELVRVTARPFVMGSGDYDEVVVGAHHASSPS